MGTNYYLTIPQSTHPLWPSQTTLHIGKSSGGWCFALHVMPERGINTLRNWQELFVLPGVVIVSEEGEVVTAKDMVNRITVRHWKRPFKPDAHYKTEQEMLDSNSAEWGPNGLLRARIDKTHCVGHGIGTWDYIVGEFS